MLAYLGCDCNKKMNGLAGLAADSYAVNPITGEETVTRGPAPAGTSFNLSPLLNTVSSGFNSVLQYKLLDDQMRLQAARPQVPQYQYVPVPQQTGLSPAAIVGIAAAGLGVIGLVLLLKRKRG